MKRRLTLWALAGVTGAISYLVSQVFAQHEGPFGGCNVSACGPDELPGLVFLALWGALFAVSVALWDE